MEDDRSGFELEAEPEKGAALQLTRGELGEPGGEARVRAEPCREPVFTAGSYLGVRDQLRKRAQPCLPLACIE